MSWSSAGSVATYPTFTPTYVAAWGAGTPRMTFRLDPNSRIVYVTGSCTGTASGTLATIPAAIRPLTSQFVLVFGTSTFPASAIQMVVTPAGGLSLNSGYTGNCAANGLYFLDL